MERIGIFGGTFNPPHIGHIQAAKQAAEILRLDRLLLIPTRIAPHKAIPEGSPSPEQRLEMLRLAAADIPAAEVLDLELRREGPSYTYMTVLELKERYPGAELLLILGTDMFLTFHTWREAGIIGANAELAVLCRGEKNEDAAIAAQKANLEAMGMRVTRVNNPVTAVSSTDLRRLLVFGCAGPWLPDGVGAYIREHGLYGTADDLRRLPMEKLEQAAVRLLDPGRVNHVLGCRDTAAALARRWGVDETDAARAGLLHDITKALSPGLQLTLCREYGIFLDDFSRKNPKTLHALTGSLVAERIFGECPAVVSAIRYHTTGRAGMNLLEKIIYVADYMEPGRTFPGVEKLRELAWADMDGALKLGLEMTLALLNKQGSEVSPESREALDWLNRKERCEC